MKGKILIATAFACVVASAAHADDSQDLAIKLANPVATLISVPFQGNYNGGIGPEEEGEQVYFNVQPVVPFTVNADWNVISRTILPVVRQEEIFPGAGEQIGLGNTLQSFFLSPERVINGWILGAGPVLYLPTHTDELLGPEKWGAGPTAVALWQGRGWTVGALANHVWSFAGNAEDKDVNATFVEPFISYTTPDAWTFTLDTESTYDWEMEEWLVPLNLMVSKMVKVGGQPISIFGGLRYWAVSPEDVGPEGWGARFGATFLFPR